MLTEHEDFIEVYENIVPADKCRSIIQYYEEMSNIHRSYNRQQVENIPNLMKQDTAIDCAVPVYRDGLLILPHDPTVRVIQEELLHCLNLYVNKFGSLQNERLMCIQHKVQKTLPSEGYHVWHAEWGGQNVRRALVYTLYLNDVHEGGETEFLYQRRRIPSTQGSICLFPAAFTHLHRGNPPLIGEKYIMTGWFENTILPDGCELIEP